MGFGCVLGSFGVFMPCMVQQMLYIGNAWKGKTPRTWHFWNIKIPKPPCISSLKIIGLLHFWKILGPSEENYNLQSFWITLYTLWISYRIYNCSFYDGRCEEKCAERSSCNVTLINFVAGGARPEICRVPQRQGSYKIPNLNDEFVENYRDTKILHICVKWKKFLFSKTSLFLKQKESLDISTFTLVFHYH